MKVSPINIYGFRMRISNVFKSTILIIKDMMKNKLLILTLMISCLLSCDKDEKEMVIGGNLQTECGNAIVSCLSFENDKLLITFNGDFLINFDSLNMIKEQNNRSCKYQLDYVYLVRLTNNRHHKYKYIKLSDSIRSLVVHHGEELFLNLKNEKTFRSLVMGGKATILPSSFILCDDVPVIKDTISIYSQEMWKRKNAKPRGKGNRKKSQD